MLTPPGFSRGSPARVRGLVPVVELAPAAIESINLCVREPGTRPSKKSPCAEGKKTMLRTISSDAVESRNLQLTDGRDVHLGRRPAAVQARLSNVPGAGSIWVRVNLHLILEPQRTG